MVQDGWDMDGLATELQQLSLDEVQGPQLAADLICRAAEEALESLDAESLNSGQEKTQPEELLACLLDSFGAWVPLGYEFMAATVWDSRKHSLYPRAHARTLVFLTTSDACTGHLEPALASTYSTSPHIVMSTPIQSGRSDAARASARRSTSGQPQGNAGGPNGSTGYARMVRECKLVCVCVCVCVCVPAHGFMCASSCMHM
eukprot:scaffold10922_cov19-Tisochrysis_lutea.AAC.2